MAVEIPGMSNGLGRETSGYGDIWGRELFRASLLLLLMFDGTSSLFSSNGALGV
jgi:hypothetical protein